MDVSSNPLKRGATSSDGKDEGKRAKTELVDSKIDKISDLPEPAIHQILSRLHPKDAARSCVLSKRWQHAWNSYQTLDIDLCDVGKKKRLKQLDSYTSKFDDLLERRKKQPLDIYKFRLRLNVTKKLLKKAYPWISVVLEKNVRELEIQAKGHNSYMLSVPLPVFRGSLIKTLTLYGCTLPNISDLVVDLPNLQRLSLKNLVVSIEFLEKMFTCCPKIDELRLIQCYDLKTLFIKDSSRVLKRLDVHKCRNLRRIVVENPSLESFWFYPGEGKNCSLKLTDCFALKNLVLECPKMDDAKFKDLILEFTQLEKLVLSRCYNLKNIQIPGDKLRKLVIRRCRKLVEARVNSPNLVSLEYQGQRMPFVFNTLSHLKEAFLRFGPSAKGKTKWKVQEANRLKGLFSHLFDLTGLKMMTLTKQEVEIYEDIPASFSPQTRINKSHSVILSPSYQDLLTEALLKWPYPSKLSVYSHGVDSEFSEDIYKTLDKGKGETGCCAYFKNKCWKHYLNSIKAEKWVSESSQFAYLGGPEWRLTVFSLDWNTNKDGEKKVIAPSEDSKKPVDEIL